MANLTPQQAISILQERLEGFNRKVKVMAEYNAAQMENASKQNAPWTDRTGNARNSIFANVDEVEGGVELVHGIGIEYGKYLEVSNQGKYRIIKPTVDEFTPRIKKNITSLKI